MYINEKSPAFNIRGQRTNGWRRVKRRTQIYYSRRAGRCQRINSAYESESLDSLSVPGTLGCLSGIPWFRAERGFGILFPERKNIASHARSSMKEHPLRCKSLERAAGNPSVSLTADSVRVAGIACSPLWLKTCHRHVFLTRRAPYTGEPYLLRRSRRGAEYSSTINQDGRRKGAKPSLHRRALSAPSVKMERGVPLKRHSRQADKRGRRPPEAPKKQPCRTHLQGCFLFTQCCATRPAAGSPDAHGP